MIEIRSDYPVNKNKDIYHKSIYLKGFLLEELDNDKVIVDIAKSSSWTLQRIESICDYYSLSNISELKYNPIKIVKPEKVILVCDKKLIRQPLTLVEEKYFAKDKTSSVQHMKECGYYGCGKTTGYNFESSGSYGFLQDTFDKLITGEKEEYIYTSGRWNKEFYRSIRYFTPESIEHYKQWKLNNVS